MISSVRILNGYRVVYAPDHPRAMTNDVWRGYVYEHIEVVEKELGRRLSSNEVVHHLDGNKANNRVCNLLVLDNSQHSRLHQWIDKGMPFLVTDELSGKYCEQCGRTLQGTSVQYCSEKCYRVGSRWVPRPSYDDLLTDMQSMSMVAVGKKYGVSDNAVRKWLRAYKGGAAG